MRQPTDRVIVFDLDDTLYLERDYAVSGFRAAAASVFAHDPRLALRFASACQRLFAAGLRGSIFDEALRHCEIDVDPDLVARLIAAYRGHRPNIVLAPDAERYLISRPAGLRSAIITDGPAASQEGKIAALGLGPRMDKILCTAHLGQGFSKPHPKAYQVVADWARVAPEQLVYVADNPAKDFVTPRKMGWMTVQIVRAGRIHLQEAPDPGHAAHRMITSFDDFDACLDALDSEHDRAEGRPAASGYYPQREARF